MNQRQITSNNLHKLYVEPELEKGGKPGFLGEVRNWQGRDFKKTAKGWIPVVLNTTEHHNGTDLTGTDINFIKEYSAGGYNVLNANLRKGIEDSRTALLNNALGKLPDFKGTVYRVGRVTDLEKYVEDFTKGDLMPREDFLSTSHKSVNSYFSFGKGISKVFYEIESKTGKSIQHFSETRGEYEVLFKSYTVFETVGIKVNKYKDGPYKGKPINVIVKLKEI